MRSLPAAFSIRSRARRPRGVARLAAAAALVALALGFAQPAVAAPAPKQLISVINAAQETPPTGTAAQGVGHFTFTDSTLMLCYAISYQGLGSAEILAHIHGPALPGVPAGIVFALPLGASKAGCVGPLTKQQKSDLLKNLLYVNIHSVGFPGGEIRGQILRIK